MDDIETNNSERDLFPADTDSEFESVEDVQDSGQLDSEKRGDDKCDLSYDCIGSGSMSMEDLIKLRDKIGIKKLEEQLNSGQNKVTSAKRRKNKNCPQEISSKKRVPVNLGNSKKQPQTRDPRFDALCGSEFNQDVFDKRYAFVDEIKSREQKELQKQLKKAKNSDKVAELKYLLNRSKQQQKAKEQRVAKRKMELEWKQEEKAKVAKGKKPYFLKQSEKDKLFKTAASSSGKGSTKVFKEKMKVKKEMSKLNLKRRSTTTD